MNVGNQIRGWRSNARLLFSDPCFVGVCQGHECGGKSSLIQLCEYLHIQLHPFEGRDFVSTRGIYLLNLIRRNDTCSEFESMIPFTWMLLCMNTNSVTDRK